MSTLSLGVFVYMYTYKLAPSVQIYWVKYNLCTEYKLNQKSRVRCSMAGSHHQGHQAGPPFRQPQCEGPGVQISITGSQPAGTDTAVLCKGGNKL